MIDTVSFHIVKPCNAKCKFCYATFEDFSVKSQISPADAKIIIDKLHDNGIKKITFAGGEPTLYKKLYEVVTYTKKKGIVTSIITNGSMIDKNWISQYSKVLDWIGVSVDSLNPETNLKIGRTFKNVINYYSLFEDLKSFKIKVNTVVNKYNEQESIQDFIDFVNPDRWKIFDTLRIVGQNDSHWEEIKSTDFQGFVNRHFHPNMVVEDNNLMTGSYLLIDPLGRMFENTLGSHSYSHSLITNSYNECYQQLQFNEDRFIARGGIYNY